jgi:hypothetical protein
MALSRNYQFEGDVLARAIAATFARRKTAIPAETPVALTQEFAEDPAKRRQWLAFAEGIEAKVPSLAEVVRELEAFLVPHGAKAALQDAVS